MLVSVRFPSACKGISDGIDIFFVDAGDLFEMVELLDEAVPGIKYKLLDDEGRFRTYFFVQLNGVFQSFTEQYGLWRTRVRKIAIADTKLADGDSVVFVPGYSGA